MGEMVSTICNAGYLMPREKGGEAVRAGCGDNLLEGNDLVGGSVKLLSVGSKRQVRILRRGSEAGCGRWKGRER